MFRKALQSPEVISLVERLEKGEVLSFFGIVESGKAFLINLLASATHRGVCVLSSSIKQQEYLYSEIVSLASFAVPPNHISLFPEMESNPWTEKHSDSDFIPDFEASSEILNTLRTLQKDGATSSLEHIANTSPKHRAEAGPHIIITTEKGSRQKIPSPDHLEALTKTLRVGEHIEMETLAEELIADGYENEAQVTARGQFARRGGILDVFPLQSEAPVRIEFNGDEIESIRWFDVETQASVRAVTEVELTSFSNTQKNSSSDKNEGALKNYLPKPHLVWRELSNPRVPIEVSLSNALGKHQDISLEIFGHEFLANTAPDPVLQEQRQNLLLRHWKDWLSQNWEVVICCNNEGEERRLRDWITQSATDGPQLVSRAQWIQAPLLRGFSWPSVKLAILSDAEIFGRYQTLQMARLQRKMARARARREVLNFSQFVEGDFVVHIHHGIGQFMGIRKVAVAGRGAARTEPSETSPKHPAKAGEQEVLTLEYANQALLHVPVEQAHLVGRYVGLGKAVPTLDQLGGSRWEKAAVNAQRAIQDYAAELLKIEGERKAHQGFSFAKDNEWQKEFEDSFLYEETPDQLTAIADTKEDMESAKPMDRLICGDVGFGKTEVAIRAAFKAVMSGKQVALLAPTTVLAQQHERTFHERMADYPVRIDLVSRFRSKKEQCKTLADAREGAVDILIGTHRLLQPDVHFKNLGLVIVDEEQRFGVKHKERFKQFFKLVDILTLSATPIPRTLYLSLMGAKNISTIETPPPNRLPVETMIAAYDERLIRSAIERELARGGQVYFLHNRVQSIQRVRDRILELIPKARVDIGHGQMDENDLEAVMMRFVAGETDVLVATTIIESGLDIPRANTIIIDRADRFGLADLYQLRGRVGRSQTKAYAYLLLPRHLMIEADARKRVSAIKQYSHLGAGFKVAMRDLEIRGAGNILGTEQSGHATAIGFELYCQLLKETLAKMKGEKVPPRFEVQIRLDFLPMSEDQASKQIGAYIPHQYMNETRLRIEAYRHLAEVSNKIQLKDLANQWRDRFGKHLLPVIHLLDLARIRLEAGLRGVTSIEVENDKVMLRKGGSFITIGGKFPRLTFQSPKQKLEELLKLVKNLGVTR